MTHYLSCEKMAAGTYKLGDQATKDTDNRVGKGFQISTWVEIFERSEEIYDDTKNLEPHERLARITNYVLESLIDINEMTDEKKSEFAASAIEDYRKRLGLA